MPLFQRGPLKGCPWVVTWRLAMGLRSQTRSPRAHHLLPVSWGSPPLSPGPHGVSFTLPSLPAARRDLNLCEGAGVGKVPPWPKSPRFSPLSGHRPWCESLPHGPEGLSSPPAAGRAHGEAGERNSSFFSSRRRRRGDQRSWPES